MKQIFLFTTALVIISSCQQKKDLGEVVVVDKGVEIPITPCVEANKKIFGRSIDATAFCKCVIPKLYEEEKNDPEKARLLKEGQWSLLSTKDSTLMRKYEDCMLSAATNDTTAKMHFTAGMKEKMRAQMKEKLKGSEIELTNDIPEYCDCMIAGIEDFSASEMMQKNFNETAKYKAMQTKCLETTRKK